MKHPNAATLWTMLALVLVLEIGTGLTDPYVVAPKESVVLYAGNTFELAEPMPVSAGSGDYFLIQGPGNQMLEGKLSEPPPGWSDKLYFSAVQTIPAGKWEVSEGYVRLVFDSQVSPTSIHQGSRSVGIWVVIVFVGLLVWAWIFFLIDLI